MTALNLPAGTPPESVTDTVASVADSDTAQSTPRMLNKTLSLPAESLQGLGTAQTTPEKQQTMQSPQTNASLLAQFSSVPLPGSIKVVPGPPTTVGFRIHSPQNSLRAPIGAPVRVMPVAACAVKAGPRSANGAPGSASKPRQTLQQTLRITQQATLGR